MISTTVIMSALELGFIYALVALALFLSFRVLNIADMTTDGAFTLGCAVSATLAVAGHPLLALPSAMLAGANLGLFAYLLTGQLVGKSSINYLAALISGATMLFLTKVCRKVAFLQEISLGVSMLAGMFLAQLFAR